MKIALRLTHTHHDNPLFHWDSFDLTQDAQRRRFIERGAEETGLEKELIKRDLGKLLLLLEQEQTERLTAALEPEKKPAPALSAEERAEALAFLQAPDLVKRISEAFEVCGLVGEETNRLAAYLACTSRKLSRPLAVIIQSTSAAGKTTLMDAVLAMFPEEGPGQVFGDDRTEPVLSGRDRPATEDSGDCRGSRRGEGQLRAEVVAERRRVDDCQHRQRPADRPHGDAGISRGRTDDHLSHHDGGGHRRGIAEPLFHALGGREPQQTERIHVLQRQARTLEGLQLRHRRQQLLKLLRNAQRLLRPVDVVNDYATELTFTSERTRARRDHDKYLTLIETIALLHQYQRAREKGPAGLRRDGVATATQAGEFIRVSPPDIALANQLAPELLGRSLDELPPQTRRLLTQIQQRVRERCEREKVEQRLALFSRRELQAVSGWSYSQVKRHLVRLQEQDYIAPRCGRNGSAYQYELLIDCQENGDAPPIGLIDVAKLGQSAVTTPTRTGLEGGWTPPGRPPCQDSMARVTVATPAATANLATLPARTSGAASRTAS